MNIKDYIKNNKNSDIYLSNNKLVFYGLTLASEKTDEPIGMQNTLKAMYKGKTIVDDDLISGGVEDADVEVNFPAPGMTTLIVTQWNGGVWCCWGYQVFVKNGDSLVHTIFFQERMSDRPFVQEHGRLRLFDHRLLHFNASNKDNSVSFAPAYAPWLPRYAIFENNAWRVNNEGELATEYKKMEDSFTDTASLPNQDPFSLKHSNAYDAIMRTFYCLMEGGPDERCHDVMKKVLNEDNRSLFKPLWAGVVEKVMCYRPIQFSTVY
ncbi:hypothetical protein GTA51_14095 [Desulfovibrio aerotolerans]|uniref:Uncharacterized protein n=1 Tax=Solidesulfovibrio aerotolerans TaxID=295255 RepID=A0A7C9IPL8_9BACT|nr:hypothetical protein [Solidesulfovibrio aerotolerans]MYL84259.1 hypothetical protein [Solidesulfovibrio aerotolerans]